MSGNNGCPNDVNDFERGYDQAVQEVLDAVAEHDVAAAMRSDPNLEYLVRGLIGAAHRRGWDGPDGVLPSAAEAPPATSDIGAYEAGVRYEHERIERLIMGRDPIEPSDRAY